MAKLTYIDRQQAFRYAGMHGKPTEQLEKLADRCEQRLIRELSPKFVYRIYPLERLTYGIHCVGSSVMLSGNDIAAHLNGCSHAVLFCATLSFGADRAIRMAQAEDVTAALLTDAMASAATEQFCDIAEREILRDMQEHFATWRYSPGYGDLPLDMQVDILAAVDAPRRIGVCVSESGLLTPRKSVTAIIGLSDRPIQRKRRGCAACNLVKTCAYRAKGAHCK